MAFQCRCMNRIKTPNGSRSSRECGKRKTLRMKPADYIRQPQCPACGGRKWGLDNYRRKKELPNQDKCDCIGVLLKGGHPLHRKGSKGCVHHKDNLKEQEMQTMGAWEEGRE